MDLENTLSTLPTVSSQDLAQIASAAAEYIPEDLSQVIDNAASYIPTQVDLIDAAQFILYFVVASLVLSVLGRVMLGKRSSLNSSLSSVMGILFIYAVTIVVYTFKPWDLVALLSPLPFVTFTGEYLIIFPLTGAQLPELCAELLSLVILAFLVNLSDVILPRGENLISWFLMRLLGVVTSMALHLLAQWALNTFLPGVVAAYAPTILLFLLGFMLLSGIINFLLGLVIAVSNPFLGAMYTFFFSNIIGKQLSKAVFTSAILCTIVFLLEYFGYTIICISATALIAYIPLVVVLLVLWYIIGHLL